MLVRRFIPGQCIGGDGVDKMPQGSRYEPGHRQRCMVLADGEWQPAAYCRMPGAVEPGFYAKTDEGWVPVEGVTHWQQLAPPPRPGSRLRLPLYIPEPVPRKASGDVLAAYLAPGSDVTLNAALRYLGLTTRPSCFQYQKEILRGAEVVFRGDAGDVTAWLRVGGAGVA